MPGSPIAPVRAGKRAGGIWRWRARFDGVCRGDYIDYCPLCKRRVEPLSRDEGITDSSAIVPRIPSAASTGTATVCRDDSTVSLALALHWRSPLASHTDCIFAGAVNLWRDLVPDALRTSLIGATGGAQWTGRFEPGDLVADRHPGDRVRVARSRFNSRYGGQSNLVPRSGRFYPRGVLAGSRGIVPQDATPLRVIGVENDALDVDLAHPLAGKPLALRSRLLGIADGGHSGGLCTDVVELVTAGGPGMQGRYQDVMTDFWSDGAFAREDDAADSRFYRTPRLVGHLDRTASGQLAGLYRQVVPAGAHVLDLMSSWQSHLDDDMPLAAVTGLGLNAEELQANARLTQACVHDLNRSPRLPFGDAGFDAVVCSVSVEYLVHPVEVFQDVARVLKPGGVFVVTFSNRWFPPKAIAVWSLVHEFERPALVLEYFSRSGAFDGLQTWSMRGLPRPADDKYAQRLRHADPVHAVWGYRRRAVFDSVS